jgi:cobalt-zinc-cadmium efflux system outer membrane protein
MREEHRVPAHGSLFALALLVAAPAAPAQASLSLADALRRRRLHPPTVQSRSAQLEAARETAAQADQLPDPQPILGVENLPIGASPLESDPASMTMRKIGLMQAFPAAAKRRARRALADRFVDRPARAAHPSPGGRSLGGRAGGVRRRPADRTVAGCATRRDRSAPDACASFGRAGPDLGQLANLLPAEAAR